MNSESNKIKTRVNREIGVRFSWDLLSSTGAISICFNSQLSLSLHPFKMQTIP